MADGPGQGVGRRYVEGVDDVLAAFKDMTEAIERRVAKQVEATARDVHDAAEDAAPKDTGWLKSAIKVKRIGKTMFIVYVDARDRLDAIASNVQEFGRTNHPYPLEAQQFMLGASALFEKPHKAAIRKIIREERTKRFGK